ncbi:hypothetical protein RFI_18485 [Reticulomyxa filosa]|uniref:Ribosomal RNA methyltransferase FtsJ domain-containing protein n=1 Tax=Reticulomyxa filosa TaxID=46433 RepID=X6N0C8_RETFI|nr:hypothetical protein RFI_18485 [Reticulomyxa filosa]|eukprot:ETO18772.1 hypothetical protein RFI_18485 [Reticulomyxa filosa]
MYKYIHIYIYIYIYIVCLFVYLNDRFRTFYETKFANKCFSFVQFVCFFVCCCETFRQLQQQRRDGYENEHVERFFDLKYRNQDNSNRSSDQNVVQLFRRFYRYAIDIDNGCHYVEWMVKCAKAKQVSYFLDIGFAPGGMSKLLLDGCNGIRGMGITLPPESKGNAIIRELYRHKKFFCREFDIVSLAKQINRRIDFMKLCKFENEQMFPGFDLVIIGITIHQEFDEAGYQRLDHQILLSELYVAFQTLARGGAILMRHKISLDLIHQHILYMMLTCFSSFKCHKPMTEFAIRKTFWILWTGFDSLKAQPFIQNLRHLVHVDKEKPPYAINRETGKFFDPAMVKKSGEEIIAEQGDKMLQVMVPMFHVQLQCIEDYCQGKKDRLCKHKDRCSDSGCMKAHKYDDLLRGVQEAQDEVDKTMFAQIELHKHSSPILYELSKLPLGNKADSQKRPRNRRYANPNPHNRKFSAKHSAEKHYSSFNQYDDMDD